MPIQINNVESSRRCYVYQCHRKMNEVASTDVDSTVSRPLLFSNTLYSHTDLCCHHDNRHFLLTETNDHVKHFNVRSTLVIFPCLKLFTEMLWTWMSDTVQLSNQLWGIVTFSFNDLDWKRKWRKLPENEECNFIWSGMACVSIYIYIHIYIFIFHLPLSKPLV